jgi:hypothetical protein
MLRLLNMTKYFLLLNLISYLRSEIYDVRLEVSPHLV